MVWQPLVFGVLLPAVVSGVVFLAGWAQLRRCPAWLGAVAVAAGYVVGHVGLDGMPPLPPVEASQWLPWLAVVGLGASFPATRQTLGTAHWFWRVPLAIGVAWLVLRPLVEHTWTGVEGVAWLVGLGLALSLSAWGQDRAAAALSGLVLALAQLLVWTGLSVVAVASGSARLAQLAGVLAAVWGAAIVAVLLRRDQRLSGAAAGASLPFAGLLLNVWFYVDPPLVSAAALLAAPAATAVALVPVLRARGARVAGLAALGATLVVVGIAVGIAVAASLGQTAGPYPY